MVFQAGDELYCRKLGSHAEAIDHMYRLRICNTSLMDSAMQEQKPLQRPARQRPRFYDSDSSGDPDEEEPEDSDDEVNFNLVTQGNNSHALLGTCQGRKCSSVADGSLCMPNRQFLGKAEVASSS